MKATFSWLLDSLNQIRGRYDLPANTNGNAHSNAIMMGNIRENTVGRRRMAGGNARTVRECAGCGDYC